MSKILEDSTIINHITGDTMIRTRVFYNQILLLFFKSWDIKDAETNEDLPITLEIINNDHQFKTWSKHFLEHKKKDDLADSFLQGLWFIKNKI